MRGGPVAWGQVKELETSMDGGWVVVGAGGEGCTKQSGQGRGDGLVDGWVASVATEAGMCLFQ